MYYGQMDIGVTLALGHLENSAYKLLLTDVLMERNIRHKRNRLNVLIFHFFPSSWNSYCTVEHFRAKSLPTCCHHLR